MIKNRSKLVVQRQHLPKDSQQSWIQKPFDELLLWIIIMDATKARID